MKLAGFNFRKISIEKLSDNIEKLNVKANIEIKDIIKIKESMIKSKEDLLAINFIYTLDYSPDFAKLEFTGGLVVTIDPKEAKEVLKKWEDKKTPEKFRIAIYNLILRKSNIKALSLEEELALPLHIQLPFFKKEEDSK